MKKKTVSAITLTLLLTSMLTLAFNIQPVRTEPATIIVPDDYSTIQEAINHALEGDTVFVRNGTYYENVVVNKTLSLIGENKDETFVDGKGTGTVFTITQDDINITGFTIQNSKLDGGIDTGSGIYLAHACYCNIKNNSIANNSYGIANYWSSNNNTICGNNIIENDQYGIYISEGDCNTICYNRLSFNRNHAVILVLSSYNTLRDNIISKNERNGIWFTVSSDHNILINNSVFDNGWDGIGGGYDSKHNLIHQNRIWNCSTGIYFDHNNYTNTVSNNFIGPGTGTAIFLDQTKNVTISNNTCLQNEIGIRLGFYTSDNIIYHNSFVNNTQQVDFWGPSYVNFWDDGYPSGGNYWNVYNGTDEYSGPNQDEIGNDGIGDTSYIIDENNRDRYPLMVPWGTQYPHYNWPMFHRDISHTGYSNSKAPNTNDTIWNYTTGYGGYSSPTVADGQVYIGSGNKVYCLDAATGTLTWNYTTGRDVMSSPAVVDGKVYIGSMDRKVYCLNASTGKHIWNYTTGGDGVGISSPAVVNGKVYIGSYDGNVYCLNASNGSKIWNYTTGSGVDSSPAVAENRVYVGSYDGRVYCLDALTGTQIWNYTTGSVVESSPAVADGKVYVGSEDFNVYCLNATSGAHLWNYTTGNGVWSSPAFAYGKVYVGSWDNKIYCLDASSGTQLWNYTTGRDVASSPAVADGKLFVGSWNGKVYCLNASTGAHIWSYKSGAGVYSSPAVADGKVYVASLDGKVYAFGGSHEVAVTDVVPSKTVVNQGYSTSMNVTVENRGDFDETFNVTLYANTTAIATQTVTLTSGNSKTITFTWNTTGFAKGNYTIKAVADIVSGEMDAADNTFIDGWVFVAMVGDVDANGKVDMIDLWEEARHFGIDYPDPRYKPNFDIDDNGKIDMLDLWITAKEFGKIDP